MSKIKNIESTPSYISEFLNRHMDSLIHIHDEGMKEHGDGCLGFKCSENDNKMDVFYMDRDTILTTISEESWEQIKISMNDIPYIGLFNEILNPYIKEMPTRIEVNEPGPTDT